MSIGKIYRVPNDVFYVISHFCSSSSRSESTNMSGGSLPPSYDATMGRGPNAPSIISDQSLQSFQIRDPKLRESLKKCQINPKLLKVGDLIKEGNFGAVYKGVLTNHGRQEQVAVKTLKVLDDTGAFEEFMKEGILTKGKKILDDTVLCLIVTKCRNL